MAIFLAHHTKKRPFYLNMMPVTDIDKPSSEERVMVTHEGKEACCYVQGNWDSPSCADIFQEWSRTPGVNRQVWVNEATNVINNSSLPGTRRRPYHASRLKIPGARQSDS